MNKIIGVTRIILMVFALLSIFFHIGFVLDLSVDVKYGVVWFTPEILDAYCKYLIIHIVFLLNLVVYLILEYKKERKKKSSCHDCQDTPKLQTVDLT